MGPSYYKFIEDIRKFDWSLFAELDFRIPQQLLRTKPKGYAMFEEVPFYFYSLFNSGQNKPIVL